jgi:ABC-type glycerol-3-phosphate transport system substrate-binding protein
MFGGFMNCSVRRACWAVLFSVLGLSACGGGGGSGASTTTETTGPTPEVVTGVKTPAHVSVVTATNAD